MVCDDSAVIRAAITAILRADPGIEVVARVANGQAALDALKLYDVDVVVLDIEMPVMDGLTALPLLLAASPGIAVVMASTLTVRGAEISMRALRLGAADTLAKPSAAEVGRDDRFRAELIAKVLGLTRLRRRGRTTLAAGSAPAGALPAYMPGAPIALRPLPMTPPKLLAIGSSTGGPNALFALVQSLRSGLGVPVVITQHMPAAFVSILAQHIDRLGVLPCAAAQDGDVLVPGRILLAPGDHHMLIRKKAGQLVVELSDSAPEQFCRPAVDPMLRSASDAAGGRVLAVILTGMGSDGLAGARHLIEAGGAVLAQDEATSVVWGMPGAVARAGLASAVLPLAELGGRILSVIDGPRGGVRR